MKNKILIEFHNWKLQSIVYYFFIKVLKKNNCTVHAFITYPDFFDESKIQRFASYIKILLGNILSLKNFGFYKSIGVEKIFKPIIKKKIQDKATIYYKKKLNKKISYQEIKALKVDNIHIGDILIDCYLKAYKLPTIDVANPKFKVFLKNFLSLFFYWEDYFKLNKVKAVVVTHDTYFSGLPLRIALTKNIKSVIGTYEKLFQLSNKNKYPYKEFMFYRKRFSKLKRTLQKKALKFSEKKIIEKFNGSNFYYPYLYKSAFKKNYDKKRVLSSSKKYKVLILPHSFIDSPNGFGGSLFPDFYQWLIFLFKISKNTNYEWYVKVHSDFKKKYSDPTYELIKKLVSKKYPNIKWLSSDTPHNNIIKEGINAVFTAQGSVGNEYPFFNIPVINASLNNPHIKYNFNLHPKNIKELETIIYNLPKLKVKIDKDEIKEFFFMHKILPQNNWLGINISQFTYEMGGELHLFRNKNAYDILMNKVDEEKTIKNLKKFLSTNKYTLDYNLIERIRNCDKL